MIYYFYSYKKVMSILSFIAVLNYINTYKFVDNLNLKTINEIKQIFEFHNFCRSKIIFSNLYNMYVYFLK